MLRGVNISKRVQGFGKRWSVTGFWMDIEMILLDVQLPYDHNLHTDNSLKGLNRHNHALDTQEATATKNSILP